MSLCPSVDHEGDQDGRLRPCPSSLALFPAESRALQARLWGPRHLGDISTLAAGGPPGRGPRHGLPSTSASSEPTTEPGGPWRGSVTRGLKEHVPVSSGKRVGGRARAWCRRVVRGWEARLDPETAGGAGHPGAGWTHRTRPLTSAEPESPQVDMREAAAQRGPRV